MPATRHASTYDREAMTVIDINIDAGESYGAWSIGDDAGTFPYATSVNLACGFHGGDPASMFAAARLALEHGLAIGAHPGLPDLVGFGRQAAGRDARAGLQRRRLPGRRAFGRARRAWRDAPPRQAPRRILDARGEDPAVADGVLRAVHDIDPALPLIVMAGSQLERSAAAIGHPSVAEALPGTRLRAERPARASRHPRRCHHRRRRGRAPRRAHGRRGQGRRDRWHDRVVRPRTLCVHGDNPHAARIAGAVRAALEAAGVELAAF